MSNNQTFPEIEAEVQKFWKENNVFKLVQNSRKDAPKKRFIDGPPFPNDIPHYGHFLCSVAKDVIPRYQTMKGYNVRRVFGWDCHGLPVEEKLNGKLNIKGSESKHKIESEIGVKKYIEMCRDLVGENMNAWRFYMEKLGRWSDMDNAYKTMDPSFGESVMWAFKNLWDKGLIYKGKRTSLYSTDSGTPVSEFEVNMDPDNYKETEDISVYMKFKAKYHKTGIGVNVAIFNEFGQVLMAERNEINREKTLGCIGGKKELSDKTIFETINRECLEEIGIIPENIEIIGSSLDIFEGRLFHTHHAKAFLISNTQFNNNESLVDLKWVSENDIDWEKLHIPTKNGLLNVFGKQTYPHIEDNTPSVYLLAWTTTPWTLYANAALAVNNTETYILVKYNDNLNEYVVLAKSLYEKSKEVLIKEFINPVIISEFGGKELVGLKYEQYLTDIVTIENQNNFKIYDADFVSVSDGTGIVHIAPAYGADDFELGKKYELSMIESIDDTGHIIAGSQTGKYLRDANLDIAKELLIQNKILKIKTYKHRLPYYRTNNPLIYKTQEGWFVNIQKIKPRMLELIDASNWIPNNIKNGRWKNTLETSPDWCISRDRYWNTIMPIWVNIENQNDYYIPGSFEDLSKYSEGKLYLKDGQYYIKDDADNDILFTCHRDKCDTLILNINGVKYKRISQVMDSWLDAGSVPFAEYHYPFENKDIFSEKPSAEFIVEYVGQVRAWFSALFRLSVGLFDSPSFDNVICTGTVAGTDGRKMSKSYGNFVDPKPVFESIGGDAIRLSLMNNGLLTGADAIVSETTMKDQVKTILLPYMNSVKYFELYANDFKYNSDNLISNNQIDMWIMQKLNEVIFEINEGLSTYDIPRAVYTLQPFLNTLSAVYIKYNRDRFVNSEKNALNTLFIVLYKFNQCIAPIIPFLTEKVWFILKPYHNLSNNISVHLENYPTDIDIVKSTTLADNMDLVNMYISLALNERIKQNIKVKQVLNTLNIKTNVIFEDWMIEILKREVNVLNIIIENNDNELAEVTLDTNITSELKELGIIREINSVIIQARRNANCDIDSDVDIEIGVIDIEMKEIISKNKNIFQDKCKVNNVVIVISEKVYVKIY